MNISKISNQSINFNKITPKAKAGIALGATAVTINAAKPKEEKQYKEPKTIFGEIKNAAQALIDRIIYLKNKHAKTNSEYNGEMLNNILNDTIAKINTDIYLKKRHNINGLEPFSSVENKYNGFGATAYKQDNEIIITYRGTCNVPCIKSDLQMMIGKVPEQFKDAEKFYLKIKEQNPECDITLTGHSLGGSLAQLLASKYKDAPAITLNAFGTDTIIKRNPKEFKNNNNSYNYIINKDIVSTSSKQVGKTVMLDRTYEKSYHDMPNYVNRWV